MDGRIRIKVAFEGATADENPANAVRAEAPSC